MGVKRVFTYEKNDLKKNLRTIVIKFVVLYWTIKTQKYLERKKKSDVVNWSTELAGEEVVKYKTI